MSEIEGRLWAAADQLRANSNLTSAQYSVPVPGLIFLRYADAKFQAANTELEGQGTGRRHIGPADSQAKGVLYLPEPARFSELLKLPEWLSQCNSLTRWLVRKISVPEPSALALLSIGLFGLVVLHRSHDV